MAVYMNGQETYKGAVIGEREHMWMDGMLEVFAVVWDDEEGIKEIQTGYIGSDGRNFMEMSHHIDATPETLVKVRKYAKIKAAKKYAKQLAEKRGKIERGCKAEVVRGRKVKKGTYVEVFWVGEKETYQSRQYSWMHEYETIAGCHTENGETVWIKAEYLRRLDRPACPSSKDRKREISRLVKNGMNNIRFGYFRM